MYLNSVKKDPVKVKIQNQVKRAFDYLFLLH